MNHLENTGVIDQSDSFDDKENVAPKSRSASNQIRENVSSAIQGPSSSRSQVNAQSSSLQLNCVFTGCPYVTTIRKYLNQHILKAHKMAPLQRYQCRVMVCRQEFDNPSALKRHMRNTHAADRPFQCNAVGCGFASDRKHKLAEHIKNVHEKANNFRCKNAGCSFSSTYRKNITHHERRCPHDNIKTSNEPVPISTESPMDTSIIELNEKQDQEKQEIVEEVEESESENESDDGFRCMVTGCHLISDTMDELVMHQRSTHSMSHRFQCQVKGCGDKFKYWGSYRLHTMSAHVE